MTILLIQADDERARRCHYFDVSQVHNTHTIWSSYLHDEARLMFHLKMNLLKVRSHDDGGPTPGDGLGDELLAGEKRVIVLKYWNMKFENIEIQNTKFRIQIQQQTNSWLEEREWFSTSYQKCPKCSKWKHPILTKWYWIKPIVQVFRECPIKCWNGFKWWNPQFVRE